MVVAVAYAEFSVTGCGCVVRSVAAFGICFAPRGVGVQSFGDLVEFRLLWASGIEGMQASF